MDRTVPPGAALLLDFIAGFEAHRLGWTTADLFAVHPVYGTLKVDRCGALMVSANTVLEVDADRIRFAASSGYRNVPGKPEGMPIWEFAANGHQTRQKT